MANSDKENVSKASVKKALTGEVISCDMEKTIVVKVNRTFKHPLLGKTVTRSKKFKAHDENEIAGVGDFVEIVECRPISKTKHMSLNCVLRKAG
jgi:small subunit ribosomal protein S17